MSSNGWLKLHRCLLDSKVFSNERLLKVWIWCLLKTSHTDRNILIGMQDVTVKAGQFVFGRANASEELGIPQSTVWGCMKKLESWGNISIESNNKFSVVTIENWASYQLDDDDIQQQFDNNSTTTRQHFDTNKNVKKVKNDKNNIYIAEIVDYLNEITGSSYKASTKKTRACIQARLNEGFTVDDFKVVIWRKTKEWKGTDYEKFLRPETLFGNKFEGYLNQKEATTDRLGWLDDVRL